MQTEAMMCKGQTANCKVQWNHLHNVANAIHLQNRELGESLTKPNEIVTSKNSGDNFCYYEFLVSG